MKKISVIINKISPINKATQQIRNARAYHMRCGISFSLFVNNENINLKDQIE